MGTMRWSPEDWTDYVSTNKNKSTSDIFARSMDALLDPKNITIRESCDSELNPLSTPIIVAVDQTGSMGYLAENLIRKGLGVLIEEIYDRKPVTDPHIMCMAVGDAWCDQAPLQVTQFESDIRLTEQLEKFYLEGNGGGNSYESYNLPWYFAATRTKCDAFLKRNKKGYLFTVGDEPPPPSLMAAHARRFLGDKNLRQDMSTREVLALVSRKWQVFHIMIAEGSYYKRNPDETKKKWNDLLGQKAITLSDYTNLAELIVSTIQINEGSDIATVADSWSDSTAIVIRNSLDGLTNAAVAGVKGLARL